MADDVWPSKDDAPDTHPTAAADIDQARQHDRRLEQAERVASGKLILPWPYSAVILGIIAVACFLGAGGTLLYGLVEASEGDGLGFAVVAGVLLFAGMVLLNYARWVRVHFETGPEPRYVDSSERGDV